MICHNCGREIDDRLNFCTFCGARQSQFEDLIQQALKGEEFAISELYTRTIEKVFFMVKILVKDEYAANDIVQDAYIKGFHSLDQLKNANSFPAWIKQIAHNKAIDWLRARKTTYVEAFSDADEQKIQERMEERVEYLPEDAMEQKEKARLIQEILDVLPEEQRAVLFMYYYEQMSLREIADALNVNLNTVKSRLNYGCKKVENQVLELERKGTKLYNLAPIPFLMALLHSAEDTAAAVPETAVLQSIKAVTVKNAADGIHAAVSREAMNASARKSVQNAAISEAVKTGAGAAAKGVVAKGVAAILTVSVIGGGVVAGNKLGTRVFEEKQAEIESEQKGTQEAETEPKVTPVSEKTQEEILAEAKERDLKLYEETLNLGIRALQEKWDMVQCINADLSENFPRNVDSFASPEEVPNPLSLVGYTLMDMDGNGTHELAFIDIEDGNQMLNLYTLENEQVVPIADSKYRDFYCICENGTLYRHGSGGARNFSESFYKVEGSSLVALEELLYDGPKQEEQRLPSPWFYTEDKELIDAYIPEKEHLRVNISEAKAEEILNKYPEALLEVNPLSSLVPKTDSSKNNADSPEAKERDLKRYSRLIDSYFTALENNLDGWERDAEYFERENLPLELGQIVDDAQKMGYALKDFNGDGTNELLIVGTEDGASTAPLLEGTLQNPIIGVYTILDNQVLMIAAVPTEYGPRYMCENGNVLWYGRSGYDYYSYDYFTPDYQVPANGEKVLNWNSVGSVYTDYNNPQKWMYASSMTDKSPNKGREISEEEAAKLVNQNKPLTIEYAPFTELQRYRNS